MTLPDVPWSSSFVLAMTSGSSGSIQSAVGCEVPRWATSSVVPSCVSTQLCWKAVETLVKVKVTSDPALTVKLLLSNSKASPLTLISKFAAAPEGVVAAGATVAVAGTGVAVGSLATTGVTVARGRGVAVAPSPPPQARPRNIKVVRSPITRKVACFTTPPRQRRVRSSHLNHSACYFYHEQNFMSRIASNR